MQKKKYVDTYTSTNDRYSQYEQKWNTTFKDCYLAWLKSEKVPFRRFMFTLFVAYMAGIGVLAGLSSPSLVYWLITFAFLIIVGISVYLQHCEKR